AYFSLFDYRASLSVANEATVYNRVFVCPFPSPQVRDVILSSTSVGARHRDRLVTGNVAGGVGDALVEHFFGADKKGKLTVDMFRSFHRLLRTELLWLEFNRFDPEDSRISERDFAKMVLSYADMNDQQRKKYMKRVKREYGDRKEGISFEDVQAFTELVENISDVEMALSMYMAAGASITPGNKPRTISYFPHFSLLFQL
ncbi:Calcium uptake protein 1, mitochondrial, partial [Geodia barretti]